MQLPMVNLHPCQLQPGAESQPWPRGPRACRVYLQGGRLDTTRGTPTGTPQQTPPAPASSVRVCCLSPKPCHTALGAAEPGWALTVAAGLLRMAQGSRMSLQTASSQAAAPGGLFLQEQVQSKRAVWGAVRAPEPAAGSNRH